MKRALDVDVVTLRLQGSTDDWRKLYQLCKDPAVARDAAAMLSQRDPDLMALARLWKFLLEDLHPDLDLRIDLREAQRELAV